MRVSSAATASGDRSSPPLPKEGRHLLAGKPQVRRTQLGELASGPEPRLLAVPVMALLLVVGSFLLPEFRDPGAGRPDLVSAGMSLAAVLAVIYGLRQLAQDGLGWPPAFAIVAGLAVGVGFVRRQRRLADPLLDLRLFGNRAFGAALATNTLSFFVGFGALLFIAQYLQLVLGLSPLAAGLWMLPSSVGFIVGSLLA